MEASGSPPEMGGVVPDATWLERASIKVPTAREKPSANHLLYGSQIDVGVHGSLLFGTVAILNFVAQLETRRAPLGGGSHPKSLRV